LLVYAIDYRFRKARCYSMLFMLFIYRFYRLRDKLCIYRFYSLPYPLCLCLWSLLQREMASPPKGDAREEMRCGSSLLISAFASLQGGRDASHLCPLKCISSHLCLWISGRDCFKQRSHLPCASHLCSLSLLLNLISVALSLIATFEAASLPLGSPEMPEIQREMRCASLLPLKQRSLASLQRRDGA
jgi:hypothetical protein